MGLLQLLRMREEALGDLRALVLVDNPLQPLCDTPTVFYCLVWEYFRSNRRWRRSWSNLWNEAKQSKL